MKIVLTCLIALALLPIATRAESPNILVIYTDDQGFGDVSALNPEAKFQTPNLDRLVHEGIAFTNGHSPDTVCTPSRYALLTGRYAWRTSLKKGVFGSEAPCLIPDDRATIASQLRDEAGYDTAMVGKWHLGMDFPGETANPMERDWSQPVQDMPLDKGFDYFWGIPASLNFGVLAWFDGRLAAVPPTLFTAKKPNDRHADYRIMPPYQATPEEAAKLLKRKDVIEVAPDFIDSECLTRFTDQAIAWMKRDRDAPFFLYLPLTSPHYPVATREDFWGQGNAGGYGEFMIETDYQVGRILDYLDDTGQADNTLIVFTSDNGPENTWKSRIDDYGHYSSGPWRGGKRDIYEGGHRVPFLVRWPAGIESPGRRWDGLVGQIDLFATFAELTNTTVHEGTAEDSVSFAEVLTSAEPEFERPPLINHGAKGRFAITSGDWKLIMPHGKLDYELYDLASDPGETTNLAKENRQRVFGLTMKITSMIVAVPNDTGYWDDLAWITKEGYESKIKERALRSLRL